MSAATVELEIPSASAYVAVARLAISALARSAGVDEERIDDLKIAVSEACTNAVLSNEAAGVAAPIRVTWSDDGDGLIVEVTDEGPAYDPDDLDAGDTQSMRLSMSFALLRTLVDECSTVSRPEGGTTTSMVIHRR